MIQLSQVQTIIAADPVRWRILRLVQELELPDCWVAAGFVRSAIWDHLHQRSTSPLPPDVDVIWFDSERTSLDLDAHIEAALRRKDYTIDWSVKNQARMHLRNDDSPYFSAADAMTHWPETATAVAVRLGVEGVVEVAAPLGLDDLFNLVVRPTARFQTEKQQIYLNRLRAKNWLATWPDLKVFPIG
ncbi:MAG: nucleotidyltransferase family protein [Pseudomonas sp.]|uniref:nucleotidyltransferase family protein n=1 Tax=Pseudomonas sp. TaxID=306 RepID=UPI002733DB57|nr:nucleotidyltransferase family protein [Pseudomonas sp.]MDP3848155.1 nucleotidyltransferase family protein [Pseudomonas sp.]